MCRKYYSAEALSTLGLESPSEDMCKERPVQDAVAQLFGWQTFFDGIPGLVLAMYFGVMADKHGRRGVLFLSMVGQTIGLVWVLFICKALSRAFSFHFYTNSGNLCSLDRVAIETDVAVIPLSDNWRRSNCDQCC